jgi:hypothetical protein
MNSISRQLNLVLAADPKVSSPRVTPRQVRIVEPVGIAFQNTVGFDLAKLVDSARGRYGQY